MGKYNFDEVIDRHGTDCLKYDFGMKRKGRDDLLPLWVADMDFRLPDEILNEFHKRIDHGIFGYTDPLDEYFAAMNHWFSTRYGYTIEPDWVTLGAGIVYALGTSVRAFTEEGDAMMVMQPVYYPFSEVIKNDGRRLVNCQLRYENNHYSIDFEKMERMILEEGVKALIFCNPHNPVGKVWTKEELKTIGDICKKHNVFVVSDEIHMDFVYAPHKHVAFYEVDPEYKNFSIVLTAASKTFNLAALQTSAAIIADEKLRNQFKKVKMSHSISDPTILGFIATTVAYTKGDEWVNQLLDYIKGNMDYLDHFLKTECPGVSLIDPQGLYLAWVDMRTLGMSNEEQEDFMLNKAHLWLDEGYVFGEEGSGFERFNLACPRSTLEKACLQLKKALDEKSA